MRWSLRFQADRAIIALATLVPLSLISVAALSDSASILRLDLTNLSLQNLANNLDDTFINDAQIKSAFLNSALLALLTVLVQLPSALLAAYGFAFFTFRGKESLFYLLLAFSFLPQVVSYIPMLVILSQVGLKGTALGVLLPSLFFSTFALAILRERFQALPNQLIDQARLDGLGALGTLVKVVLPIRFPLVGLLALVTFISSWNTYLWPKLIGGTSFPTIMNAIASFQQQYNHHWELVLTVTLLALIPTLAASLMISALFTRAFQVETES